MFDFSMALITRYIKTVENTSIMVGLSKNPRFTCLHRELGIGMLSLTSVDTQAKLTHLFRFKKVNR